MTVINMDFTEVETGAGYLPAGAHRARVQSIEVKAGQQADYLNWCFVSEEPSTEGMVGYLKILATLAKADLLILDDWGLAPFEGQAQHDLLEVIDDRSGRRSTLVATQIPVCEWHHLLPDPTVADAVLDRLVHNAVRIELKGGSMRKRKGTS